MGVARQGISAVVFDLDGVLIDSEPVWEQVRHGVVVERGGRWPPDAQTRLMGMNTAEWARYLSRELGVDLPPDQVAAVVMDRMAACYAEQLPLMPGADEALRRLASRWRLALASSSPSHLIHSVLETADWDALFEATMSTDEVGRGKPAPDVYRAVTARLDLAPSACAAVEDSSNGLRSAAAAGLLVVAVPHPRYPPAPDALAPAALVLRNLAGLTIEAMEGVATKEAEP
jgi:HAD superfamily hydrolase (TIGR01509 family)